MWSFLGKACALLSHGCDPAALTLHQSHGWGGREVAHVAHRHGADSFAGLFIAGDKNEVAPLQELFEMFNKWAGRKVVRLLPYEAGPSWPLHPIRRR